MLRTIYLAISLLIINLVVKGIVGYIYRNGVSECQCAILDNNNVIRCMDVHRSIRCREDHVCTCHVL